MTTDRPNVTIHMVPLGALPPPVNPQAAARTFLLRAKRLRYENTFRTCGTVSLATAAAVLLLLSRSGDASAIRMLEIISIIGLLASFPLGEALGSKLATRGLRMPDEVDVARAIRDFVESGETEFLISCWQQYPNTVLHWLSVLRAGISEPALISKLDEASLAIESAEREARGG